MDQNLTAPFWVPPLVPSYVLQTLTHSSLPNHHLLLLPLTFFPFSPSPIPPLPFTNRYDQFLSNHAPVLSAASSSGLLNETRLGVQRLLQPRAVVKSKVK